MEDLLDRLVVCRSLDVTWLVRSDPEERLRNRRVMKLGLSRHGRIPLDYWDDRDVVEMAAYYHDLVEMLRTERPGPTEEE